MQRLKASIGATTFRCWALLAVTVSAAQAVAQAPQPTPAGRWKFATTQMNNRCTMSGEMQVWRVRGLKPDAKLPAQYACRFTAFQTCTGSFIQKIETQQTCSVQDKAGKLHFEAKIEKIGEVKPPEILEQVKTAYAPDNFLLQLNKKGDEMDGMFISLSEAPVKFVRIEELVS